MNNLIQFEKLQISLRYFLLGKGYHNTVRALEFAGKYHTGFRKDGVTPDMMHQVEIVHYLRTLLPAYIYPQEVLTVGVLHDTKEDHGTLVTLNVLDQNFGQRVAHSCELLDKNGKTKEYYFGMIAEDEIASIVKGGDRIHNLQHMIGVFDKEKQMKYITEVETYFLPMLKTARRKFPQQENAYENIKHVLNSQIELIKELHKV
jgi:(p)ppGpp synthase/HD superfamily hydrolase